MKFINLILVMLEKYHKVPDKALTLLRLLIYSTTQLLYLININPIQSMLPDLKYRFCNN